MRLGDLDALKEDLKQYFSDGVLDSVSAKIAFTMVLRKIDNAPTVFSCNACKNMGNERECVDCHDYSNYVHYGEAKNIGEIRVNIPDDEKDKIIEELRKEPHPIVFEPEEDTATWITDEYGRKICSKCQFPFAEFQSHNYCSLCGRRMIGGTD